MYFDSFPVCFVVLSSVRVSQREKKTNISKISWKIEWRNTKSALRLLPPSWENAFRCIYKITKKRTTIGGEFNYQKHWILDVFLATICIIADGKSGNNRHKIDGFVFFFFNPNSFFEMLKFFLLNSAICGVFFHFGSSIFLVFLLSSSGSLSFISIIHSFRTRRLPWQALYYLDIFKSICLLLNKTSERDKEIILPNVPFCREGKITFCCREKKNVLGERLKFDQPFRLFFFVSW